MKARKQISILIIMIFLTLNFSISTSNITASIHPRPDQFIAEIFPNSTLPLQLSHTNTIIIFNATDFSNKIDIHFDANYTIYNPENTTTIPIIVPFSLAIDISNLNIEVHTNNSQIAYNLFSFPIWNENMTEIDISFLPRSFNFYPITFIKSNETILKNSSLVIRYQISGSMSNPLDSRDLFYIAYYLGTSQKWIGNTTGRVELRVYGKEPVFGRMGTILAPCQLVDSNGGKSYMCEWNNTKSPCMNVGIRYYRELTPFEKFLVIIAWNIGTIRLIYITIPIIIIGLVIIRKKRKKRKLHISLLF